MEQVRGMKGCYSSPEFDIYSISHPIACGGLSISNCWVWRIKTDCTLSGPRFSLFALKNFRGGEIDASGSDFSPCCAMQMFSTCLSDLLRKSLCDLLQPGPVLGIVCQIPLKVGKVNLFKDHIEKPMLFWINTDKSMFLIVYCQSFWNLFCSLLCWLTWGMTCVTGNWLKQLSGAGNCLKWFWIVGKFKLASLLPGCLSASSGWLFTD